MGVIRLRCIAIPGTIVRFDFARLRPEDTAHRAGGSRLTILCGWCGDDPGRAVPGFAGQQSTKRAHLFDWPFYVGCGINGICALWTVLDFHDCSTRLWHWSDTGGNDDDYVVANPCAGADERTSDEPEHPAHHGHSSVGRFPRGRFDRCNRSTGNGVTERQLGRSLWTNACDAVRGTFNLTVAQHLKSIANPSFV